MSNRYSSSPTVTNCNFTTNSATGSGGGMHTLQSNPTVTNCTFLNNTSNWEGGGMSNVNGSSPTVTKCIFTGKRPSTTPSTAAPRAVAEPSAPIHPKGSSATSSR